MKKQIKYEQSLQTVVFNYALIIFYLFFQIDNELSIPDYKSTSVVSFFNKPIAYTKFEDMDENN